MKGKILLMAILSASVLSGCFHVPEYKAGENVVFKNSTEREIDYIYDTNSTFSDQYQFKAQGKEIDYAAATLLPGEEKNCTEYRFMHMTLNKVGGVLILCCGFRIKENRNGFVSA